MSVISKLSMLGAGNVEDDSGPVGVSFAGSGDYLSKSLPSGLAADSKTVTFSAWVYLSSGVSESSTIFSWSTFTVNINIPAGTVITFSGFSNSYATLLGWDSTSSNKFVMDTWNHILISFDLSNSSKRHVYVNDTLVSGNYNTYVNTAIGFSVSGNCRISGLSSGWKGRMAGVYLDTTYRDLSVVSNRRDFIDADGFYVEPPSGGAISMPLANADTAGTNVGSAGDFSVNGVLGTTERGPNQYNAVASFFDGNSDDLQTTSISHSGSKTFTLSFAMNVHKNTPDQGYIFHSRDSSNNEVFSVNYNKNDGGIQVLVRNGGTIIYRHDGQTLQTPIGGQYWINISFDLSDSSKRHVYVNGVSNPPTYITYSNSFSGAANKAAIGSQTIFTDNFEGSIGEFYFDTDYVDLSSDNPFWDGAAGLPKPVRQVLEDTGNTPLIAMPIRGDSPGENLGTGGDFTVNSGPFSGARGASEFWQKSINYNSSPRGYLTNSSVFSGVSNSRQLTLFFASNKRDTGNGRYLFKFDNSSGSSYMQLRGDQGSGNYWYFNSESAGNILNTISSSTAFPSNQWKIHAFSVDLTNTSNRHYYSNRNSTGMSWQDYVNKDIPWSSFTRISIFSNSSTSSSAYWNSYTGPFYMATEYVDFSDKEKMNLFIDPMGYPRDLKPAIDDGLIPNPVIYLPFDDLDDLGKNLGTGGDFTVNNAFDVGPDVDPYA
tara:strand:+ start:954 stop:3086 length:2133 start_codon:yes stop_codon:yes gene_type:complete